MNFFGGSRFLGFSASLSASKLRSLQIIVVGKLVSAFIISCVSQPKIITDFVVNEVDRDVFLSSVPYLAHNFTERRRTLVYGNTSSDSEHNQSDIVNNLKSPCC